MDGELVQPDKLTKQPDNYNHEIQLTNKQYSDYII